MRERERNGEKESLHMYTAMYTDFTFRGKFAHYYLCAEIVSNVLI